MILDRVAVLSSPRRWIVAVAVGAALLAAACSAAGDEPPASSSRTPAPTDTSTPVPTRSIPNEEEQREEARQRTRERIERDFPLTDVERRTVDLADIIPSLPRDALRAIFEPDFDSFAGVAAWLNDAEPVIAFEHNGEARAYPIQVLIWHEVVNDIVGGEPVVVTYCPLCNSAIAFRREVEGVERQFGVSGMLRRNDLIMYDRETETLWQQISGEGIVGPGAGLQLEFLPSQIVSLEEFKQTFPDGLVLTGPVGRTFEGYGGYNPYPYYDNDQGTLYPNDEFDDRRLVAKERVLTVELNGDPVAFPFSALSERVVIEAEVGGEPVVALWQPGALSPLDEEFIVGSDNIGAAGAFSSILDGRRLHFESRDGAIVDVETGTTWNVLGRAIDGELAGAQLPLLVSGNHFWFAWAVFEPTTRVVTGP